MRGNNQLWKNGRSLIILVMIIGCSSTTPQKAVSRNFRVTGIETAWIINGEPIEFEDEKWYPTDDVEVLTDIEVYRVGEYRGVEFFVEKEDVKSYNQLYTKFSRNKFRRFEKREKYSPSP